MDRKYLLLEALKAAALQGGEVRLYRRGKLPGLFTQRTRLHTEIAEEAVREGWLEVVRAETVGKSTIEWVRVTQKGLDYLLTNESPAHALQDLRALLALNEQGVPAWLADMHARLDELSRRFAVEIEQVRLRLDQIAKRTEAAIERIEQNQAPGESAPILWGQEVFSILNRRQQVGQGERCSLAELFAAIRERHADLTIREFHQGLRRLHERRLLTLLPDVPNGEAPGPEYALLDGATVYYYVTRG